MSRADAPGYVLWVCGVLFDHDTMLRRPGVNPAGRRWQMSLIHTLQRRGEQVYSLVHAPDPIWPRGVVRDRGDDPLDPTIEGDTVAYWNLPVLRPFSLRAGYLRGFERIIEKRGPPALMLTFNAYPYNVAVGRRAQKEGIPWVCIVADVPESKWARKRHDRMVQAADGRVFLSWGEYSRSGHREPKLHLDSGVNELRISPDEGPTAEPAVVLYTGSLGHWGGVEFLLEGFQRVRRDGVELWICGHGHNPRVLEAAEKDDRIRFLGLVPEERLREVSERATVFVNPRPSDIPLNSGNFPSKVLEYLSYGKPVVSTWTAGLAPYYREVLTVPEAETPDGLAAALEDVLSWSPERRRDCAVRIRSFLKTRKLWDAQGERLATWLNETLDPPPVSP